MNEVGRREESGGGEERGEIERLLQSHHKPESALVAWLLMPGPGGLRGPRCLDLTAVGGLPVPVPFRALGRREPNTRGASEGSSAGEADSRGLAKAAEAEGGGAGSKASSLLSSEAAAAGASAASEGGQRGGADGGGPGRGGATLAESTRGVCSVPGPRAGKGQGGQPRREGLVARTGRRRRRGARRGRRSGLRRPGRAEAQAAQARQHADPEERAV